MNIHDLFTKERELYLEGLRDSLAEQRKNEPRATSEVLVEINSEKFSGVYRLIRPDIIFAGAEGRPQIVEVNKERYFSFDLFTMKTDGGVSVRISPFHWNGFEVRVVGPITDWTKFEDWAAFWIDSTDARYEEGKEWLNVVHNVTTPEYENGRWNFSIDLGSAEIASIDELFDVLIKSGAREIEVGSFSMIP